MGLVSFNVIKLENSTMEILQHGVLKICCWDKPKIISKLIIRNNTIALVRNDIIKLTNAWILFHTYGEIKVLRTSLPREPIRTDQNFQFRLNLLFGSKNEKSVK